MVIALLLVSSWLISGDSISTGQHARKSTPIYRLPSRPARQPAAETLNRNSFPAAGHAPRKRKRISPPASIRSKPAITPLHRPESIATDIRKSNKKKLPNGYYVQTGAFRRSASARKLAATLTRSGWQAHTTFKDNGLYAVLVGPSPTRLKAKNVKRKLALNLHIKGFVVHPSRDH